MKFLFAIVLALLSFVGFGQYNLQLNQVVLVSNTLQTVPAGKVDSEGSVLAEKSE